MKGGEVASEGRGGRVKEGEVASEGGGGGGQ